MCVTSESSCGVNEREDLGAGNAVFVGRVLEISSIFDSQRGSSADQADDPSADLRAKAGEAGRTLSAEERMLLEKDMLEGIRKELLGSGETVLNEQEIRIIEEAKNVDDVILGVGWPDLRRVRLEVIEAFAGVDTNVFTVFARSYGMCGYPFRNDSRYLVKAQLNDKTGRWEVHQCDGFTEPVETAAGRLGSLRTWKAGVDMPARAFGTVMDSSVSLGRLELPGVRVRLSNGWDTCERVTDNNGSFAFETLAPGDYRVTAERPGFLVWSVGSDFRLDEGECGRVEILMDRRQPTLSGRVQLSTPALADHLEMVLLPPGGLFVPRTTSLGDDGSFQFATPGDRAYRLGIALRSSPRERFRESDVLAVFGETDSPSGRVFRLRSGETTDIGEWYPPLTRAERIVEGAVHLPDGSPATGARVTLALQDDFQTAVGFGTADSDGRFQIAGLEGSLTWCAFAWTSGRTYSPPSRKCWTTRKT